MGLAMSTQRGGQRTERRRVQGLRRSSAAGQTRRGAGERRAPGGAAPHPGARRPSPSAPRPSRCVCGNPMSSVAAGCHRRSDGTARRGGVSFLILLALLPALTENILSSLMGPRGPRTVWGQRQPADGTRCFYEMSTSLAARPNH